MVKLYAEIDKYTKQFKFLNKDCLTEFVRITFAKREQLKKIRFEIVPKLPESRNLRGFFEGGLCTLFAYHHEALDHRNNDDVKKAREWLVLEFNGDWVAFGEKAHLVAKSTKGVLNEVSTQITDWFIENGMAGENNIAIDTQAYKNWKDKEYCFEVHDNWCDYLESINKLRRVKYDRYQD